MNYPVLDIIPELKKRLTESRVVILQAPPGAGKSTVLPLEIMGEPWLRQGKIVMLEPRRLAAKSVAERMAQSLSQSVGDEVGYRVRFDTKVSKRTRIEVVTEGILTRMMQTDSSLEDVSMIIFDEFHERSIHADLSLALALQIQSVLRPELRILIMSATLNTNELSLILKDAPVIKSEGKQFPVEMVYDERGGFALQRVPFAIRRALQETSGDVLVFLPGAGEIRRVAQELDGIDAVLYPLYGDLPFRKQQEAILPRTDGKRKIVLATSIAETSLTIEGVNAVVDSGLARVPRFDPRSGLTRLDTTKVTRDAADQRAGRAGRLSKGVCYRLWSQGEHLFLVEKRKPEILEADLAPLMLELANWGIKNIAELDWVSLPPSGSVNQAMDLLQALGAVDEKGITARGKRMLHLPTHPRIAHLLLDAQQVPTQGLLALATDVAALLEERDPLERGAGADLSLRVETLRRWRSREQVAADHATLDRIERLASNWRRLLSVGADNSAPRPEQVGKLLWAAYPERLAQQQGVHSNRYKLFNGRAALLPQSDPLVRERWLCVAQLDAGTNEGRIYLAAPVDETDLLEQAVDYDSVIWDDKREMVAASVEKRLGPLVLTSRAIHKIPEQKRIEVLLHFVKEAGLKVFGNEEGRVVLQCRVSSLYHWRKETIWPNLTDDVLLQKLEDWLPPFLTSAYRKIDLANLDAEQMIRTLLPWELEQQLDRLAPLRITVPSGSLIKVRYALDGSPPVVEVRLQEMFGLAETPTVNEGKTPVLLHLLSPGFKPVQVTQDLRSFWTTTYHDVRKELRMRYPKHHWPEDPWNAVAVRGAKRKS